MPRGRNTYGSRRGLLAGVVIALVALAACAPSPPPSLVPDGQPGAAGPCGSARRDIGNPLNGSFHVALFEPTGHGEPFTGGTCDDSSRPTILFVHGWLANAPEIYEGFIRHLNSQGFVVVYTDYADDLNPGSDYAVAEAGLVAGVAAAPRADTTRLGIIGHSFGGGMAPWIARQAVQRGWGSASLWITMFAPHYAFEIGDGPIDLPPTARVLIVNYENDSFVDARIGIELFHAIQLPLDHKQHLMVLADYSGAPARQATHLGPVSFEILPFPIAGLTTDDEDRWAAFRPVDAIAGCALDGRWCDTDLAYMGTWPNGRPANRGISSDDPRDRGPISAQECQLPINQRKCP